jgi:hypothetical protein
MVEVTSPNHGHRDLHLGEVGGRAVCVMHPLGHLPALCGRSLGVESLCELGTPPAPSRRSRLTPGNLADKSKRWREADPDRSQQRSQRQPGRGPSAAENLICGINPTPLAQPSTRLNLPQGEQNPESTNCHSSTSFERDERYPQRSPVLGKHR